jgi:TUTase nucleotidyltransferase domain
VAALDKARIPVLKFVMPGGRTKVDVTVNNVLPLHNTRLLRAYTDADPRLRELVFLVKHWAKQRAINDAYTGSLSSYAWVLLCIFVAQRSGIVPVLQLRDGDGDGRAQVDARVEVDGTLWAVRYTADARAVDPSPQRQALPIAGLLTMFFDYFASRCARQICTRASSLIGHAARVRRRLAS